MIQQGSACNNHAAHQTHTVDQLQGAHPTYISSVFYLLSYNERSCKVIVKRSISAPIQWNGGMLLLRLCTILYVWQEIYLSSYCIHQFQTNFLSFLYVQSDGCDPRCTRVNYHLLHKQVFIIMWVPLCHSHGTAIQRH